MAGNRDSKSRVESFGSDLGQIDTAEDPQGLLTYLDEAAEVASVRDAKQGATEALALRPGERVLDVGCGTGVDVPGMIAAVRPGGRVVGIDISELAIEQARERMAGITEVEMLVADAHDLPFPAGSFDACRVDRAMLHLNAPDQALAELRRVLAPRGRLAILEIGSRLEGNPGVVESPVQQVVATRYWLEHETVAQIPMFLPLLLVQAGFVDIRTDRLAIQSTDFEAADRLLRLSWGAEEAVRAGNVSSEAAQDWLAGVESGMEGGDVVMQSEALLFLARAPA